jgi:hypothetical protein
MWVFGGRRSDREKNGGESEPSATWVRPHCPTFSRASDKGRGAATLPLTRPLHYICRNAILTSLAGIRLNELQRRAARAQTRASCTHSLALFLLARLLQLHCRSRIALRVHAKHPRREDNSGEAEGGSGLRESARDRRAGCFRIRKTIMGVVVARGSDNGPGRDIITGRVR